MAPTSDQQTDGFDPADPLPGILVAYAPTGAVTVDRCHLCSPFTVGRASKSSLALRDDQVSKNHFRITQRKDGFRIEDQKSKNGTFVDGTPVEGRRRLSSPSVIRVGRAVLVFLEDARTILRPPPTERFGMVGSFHTGPLISELREANISGRHLLLTGETGAGKQLAAEAIAGMMQGGGEKLPFVDHNAAQFASHENAVSTLFGVGQKAYSEVAARPGLIELAHEGVLFLDELHNLPHRVQRSLLKVIEDGTVQRMGDPTHRRVKVRFVFGSNAAGPSFGLATDLLNRVRTVAVPSLAERVADIPALFLNALRRRLDRQGVPQEEVLPLLTGDHFEVLCLDGFAEKNVRGLDDLADRVATRVRESGDPEQGIREVFHQRFGEGRVARRLRGEKIEPTATGHYEKYKKEVIATFHESGGVLNETERRLNAKGIHCTRQHLSNYLKKWGIRP